MREDYWEDYLFAQHPKQELVAWARSLRFFRFCRAYGGHATDYDQLLVAISFETEHDLLETCAQLGCPLEYLPLDSPKPIPGKPYTQDFSSYPSAIIAYPHLRQPGHRELAGVKAHAWVHTGKIEISVTDEYNPYDVTAAAVQSAQHIETLLRPLLSKIIEPPLDNRYCICPKWYPEFWSTEN